MPGNSIAISRELLAAGVEQTTAAAVAEAIVTHSNDRNATKVEILELKDSLKDEINAMRNQLNMFQTATMAFQAKTEARLNMLTVIVVIGILAPYIERAFGG